MTTVDRSGYLVRSVIVRWPLVHPSISATRYTTPVWGSSTTWTSLRMKIRHPAQTLPAHVLTNRHVRGLIVMPHSDPVSSACVLCVCVSGCLSRSLSADAVASIRYRADLHCCDAAPELDCRRNIRLGPRGRVRWMPFVRTVRLQYRGDWRRTRRAVEKT